MKFEVLSTRSGETMGMYTAASQADSIARLAAIRADCGALAKILGATHDERDLVGYELPTRRSHGYIIYSEDGEIIGRGRTKRAALIKARKARHKHYWDTYFASVGEGSSGWFESGGEDFEIAKLGWRLVKTEPKCKCRA